MPWSVSRVLSSPDARQTMPGARSVLRAVIVSVRAVTRPPTGIGSKVILCLERLSRRALEAGPYPTR